MNCFIRSFVAIIAVCLLTTFYTAANAIEVSQVRGERALINLQGESANPGEKFQVLNESGEPVAIVEIDKIKDDKAIAKILEGKPNSNQVLIPYLESGSPKTTETAAPKVQNKKPKRNSNINRKLQEPSLASKKMRAAILVGLSSQSISLTAENTTGASADAKMTGTNFNIRGTGTYAFSPNFFVQVSAGFEPVSVSADVKSSDSELICSSGTSAKCEVKINYFGGDALAQYNVLPGNTADSRIRFWVGAGLGLLIVTSAETNIPNLKKPSGASYSFVAASGADIPVGSGYVPISFDYTLMPGQSVSSSYFNIRAGFGWAF